MYYYFMDEVSLTKLNYPSNTSTNILHMSNLEAIQLALSEDQTDDIIIEHVIGDMFQNFPEAQGLFLYKRVNQQVELATASVKSPLDCFLDLAKGEELFSFDSFEICARYEYLNLVEICEQSVFTKLKTALIQTQVKECLLLPIKLHKDVNAILLVVLSTTKSTTDVQWTQTHIKAAQTLLYSLFLILQKRERSELQAQLQQCLLDFKTIDETLSQFADLLLAYEESIFQIQVFSLDKDYVKDFHVYGQMTEFEEHIKENILSQGNVHIGFNKTFEQAVKTKSSIYTADVSLDPNWSTQATSQTRSIIYFPLLAYDKQVVGVFCAISNKVDGFSKTDIQLLEHTVLKVNLVFQSHFRILDLEENVSQLSQIAEISQTLQSTTSIKEAQFESLKVIVQETSANYCYIANFDKDKNCFDIQARANTVDISLAPMQRLVLNSVVLQKYLTSSSSVPLHFDSESPEFLESCKSMFGIEEDVQELLMCPLVIQDSVVSELAIILTGESFSQNNIALVQTIISSYGNCVSRIESANTAKSEAASYKELASFGAKIEELQNFDELIDYGIQQFMSIFGITDANYYTPINDTEVITNTKSWGTEIFDTERFSIDQSPIMAYALESREPVYITDYPNHPQSTRPIVEKGLKSVIFLPVEYADKVVGCIALHGMKEKIYLSDSNFDLARQFLNRLRNALERHDYVRQLEQSREDTLRSLGIVLEHRDLETQGHTDRVVTLSRNFAKQISLSDEKSQELVFGAYLHDIGKLAIPDRILLKPGKLSDEEFNEIKTHAVRGFDMANKIPLLSEASSLLVRHHHEQWLGAGYPDKLQGNEIPFLARMFTLVDVYDALRSHRPYKKAWTKEECFVELREKSGIMFDPDLVEEFIIIAEDYDDAYQDYNLYQENADLFNMKQELMFD